MGQHPTRRDLATAEAEYLRRGCERWRREMARTAPADTISTEAALADMYRLLGHRVPRIEWVDSPWAAVARLHQLRDAAGEWLTVPETPGSALTLFDPIRGAGNLRERLEWILEEHVSAAVIDVIADHLWVRVGRLGPPVGSNDELWLESPFEQEISRYLTYRWSSNLRRHGPGKDKDQMFLHGYPAWLSTCWIAAYALLRELGMVHDDGSDDRALDLLIRLVRGGCGWWWPLTEVCIVSQRPTTIATEPSRDRHGMQLHRSDGPALEFGDGRRFYAWHGRTVPADLIEDGWPVERILAERNLELRRCAIEHLGWAPFIDALRLEPIGEPLPDPGNPGQTLALYEIPEHVQIRGCRVLLCINASPERDGTRRRFALLVSHLVTDPIEAVASLLRLDREQYLTLTRAT